MVNDNKIESDEKKTKPRKPRKSAEQKAKESILAAAEEVITKGSNAEKASVPAVYEHNVVHQQVAVLLENELDRISSDDKKMSFNMEEEYAKAKKSSFRFAWKNMWSRLFLCVMVVVAITIVLSIIVNNNNKRVPVNVKGFDNVKLTELLDDVDKIESQIAEAESKKAEYESKRSDEIQKVEDAYTAEKENIEKAYAQEEKNAEKKFNQESKNLETKKTTGWMEGRTKNKDIEKNKMKYDEALASVKKRREDALAISRNKYRNNLAQAKSLYKTEISDCWNTINRLKEDRYRFDKDKVQLEAEYDGKLKDRDILHRREMDDLQAQYEEMLLKQKTEYEALLAQAAKNLEETIASDLARENNRVAATISSYDPDLLKDNRTKKIVRNAGNTEYNVGTEDRISYLPKDGASEVFKKSLKSQKEYYDDLAYLASVYGQFPQRENRAIISYVKAMKSLASKAGNEIYASSVNEVNRIIEEKNNVEYEKKAVLNEKNALRNEFNAVLEAMCQEKQNGIATGGVVTSISQKVYTLYVSEGRRSIFTSDANKGKVFPCSIYRGEKKVAIGRIDAKNNRYSLTNIAIVGSNFIQLGDRVVVEEPYMP